LLIFQRKNKKDRPTVYTENTCQTCNQKTKKTFEDGDYIYKPGFTCKVCSGTEMITAIYGEYPAEKKNKAES
jgi:hypothetical protein